MKQISIKDYCKKRGIASSGVRRSLGQGVMPRGVRMAEKIGNVWILKVDKDFK